MVHSRCEAAQSCYCCVRQICCLLDKETHAVHGYSMIKPPKSAWLTTFPAVSGRP
jgi:hypothetical protein